jgi:2-polyprenyl-3-methyl-5-hydroxy-6-metoxy-1,4-benzoquinol methylase
MDTKQAYNVWASQYDTNENKTRDLEQHALRENLSPLSFDNILEIGCGTGKNTAWLITRAKMLTAVDFSDEMLAKAREKITSLHVNFKQADINNDWTFGHGLYDLITFSLVLEHIANLDHIFAQAAASLKTGGHIYIGELHPFKQYSGSKARFDSENGLQVVECFTHNISEFVHAAKKYGFSLLDINEYFDDNDHNTIPRILTILLKKN